MGVPGVPALYTGLYQDFLNDPKPFDLRREMAMLRSLFVEARTNLDSHTNEKGEKIEKEILQRMASQLDADKETIKAILSVAGNAIHAVLQEELDLSCMSLEHSIELGGFLEQISRVAERMKKIQEGVKLNVAIDTTVLMRFLHTVVFPVVPEHDRRNRMVELASQVAVSAAPQTALPLPTVDAIFGVEEENWIEIKVSPEDYDDSVETGIIRRKKKEIAVPVDINPWEE